MHQGLTVEEARKRLREVSCNESDTARHVGVSLIVSSASLAQFFAQVDLLAQQVDLLKQQHADADARAAQWREIALAKVAR